MKKICIVCRGFEPGTPKVYRVTKISSKPNTVKPQKL